MNNFVVIDCYLLVVQLVPNVTLGTTMHETPFHKPSILTFPNSLSRRSGRVWNQGQQ